jgi:hypothetical protein
MANNQQYFVWAYLEGKFSEAAKALATSFAPNSQRMLTVMLELTLLLPHHFPDTDLYDRYEKLRRDATKFGPRYITNTYWIGALENTLKRRKRSTFERMAQEILSIHEEIVKRRGTYEQETE